MKTKNTRELYNVRASQFNEEDMTIKHVINTKCLDRYDTIVMPEGVRAGNFLKNSVVLWAHNHDENAVTMPIAKCIDLEITSDKIVATTKFNASDPFAVKVFNAYRDGFLNAWSIGFMPENFKEVTFETQEEINKEYGLELNLSKEDYDKKSWYGVWVIDSWELFEYSAVPVPGNPECLSAEEAEIFSRELVTRGLADKDEVRQFDFRKMLAEKQEPTADQELDDAELAVPDVPSDAPNPDSLEDKDELDAPNTDEPESEKTDDLELEDQDDAEKDDSEPEKTDDLEAEDKPEDEVAEPEPEPEPEPEDDSEEDEEPEKPSELSVISEKITELEGKLVETTSKNQELSETLAKVVTILSKFDVLEKQLGEVKKALEMDNIEKVRSLNSVSGDDSSINVWFGNFLKSRR